MQSLSPNPLRMPQLDGLRAIAVLMVQWAHFGPAGWNVFGGGAAGVGLFFVLSGFLISGILIDEVGHVRSIADRFFLLRQFYVRRMLRLVPLLYAIIAVAVVLNVPPFRDTWGWHLAYASNFYQWFHGRGGYGSNLWSLAVEEQFYLFWPVLLVFLPRRIQVLAMIALIPSAPLFRLGALAAFPGCDPYLMLPSAFDYLAVGSVLAAATRGRLGRFSARHLAWGGLLAGMALMAAVQWGGLGIAFHQTGLAMCFGWLVWSAAEGFGGLFGRLLESSPLGYIGKISYGIYVIQGFALYYWYWWLYSAPVPLSRVFAKLGISPAQYEQPAVTTLMAIAITLGAAALSFRLMEHPVQALKRYFPYHRGSRPTPE